MSAPGLSDIHEVALSRSPAFSMMLLSLLQGLEVGVITRKFQRLDRSGSSRLARVEYAFIAGIFLLELSGVVLALSNVKWNSWLQKVYGQECERFTLLGDPCFRPLPFF
jgi:hypothetical protein